MRICFQQGVEDDEQFAHAGGEDDFNGLSLGLEALGEGADDRVATRGGEGGHVEGAADRGAPPPNGSFAAVRSAVVVEGGESDECTDLLAIELAEFGQIGEQRRGGGGPDAGGAGEDLRLAAPLVVGFEVGDDVLFELEDALVQQVDDLMNALADRPGRVRFLGKSLRRR